MEGQMTARSLKPVTTTEERQAGAEIGAGFLFAGTLMPKGLQIFKQTDLLHAIRTFQKAGLSIARAEIDRDGRIVVVVGEGKPVDENRMTNANPWDEVLHDRH
jgi:hypothetical protein